MSSPENFKAQPAPEAYESKAESACSQFIFLIPHLKAFSNLHWVIADELFSRQTVCGLAGHGGHIVLTVKQQDDMRTVIAVAAVIYRFIWRFRDCFSRSIGFLWLLSFGAF